MLPYYIVFISPFTSTLAGYFYIRDMFKGKTKPNMASWLIWFLAPFTAGLIVLGKGGGIASLPVFMAGFSPLLVVLIALFIKNASWKMSVLDYVCLITSLLALGIWYFLDEGFLATILVIVADGIAFIPTFIKSWKAPDTETLAPYFSGILNPTLSLLTLTSFSFVVAGFSLYLILANLAEILLVYYRRKMLLYK
jgi:hypothetical protein